MFKRAEFRKLMSGSLLFASAPALVFCAYGSASLEAGSLTDNTKALVFNQKEEVGVSKTSSSLPKLILYTFLVMAGLYVLGIFDKLIADTNASVELQTNEKLVEYKKKEEKLHLAQNKLKFKLEELANILQEIKDNTEKKDNIEKGVKGLGLEKYIKVIEDANKDEKFMKILKLREEMEKFWELIGEWNNQIGFIQEYDFDVHKSHFEGLKWADKVLMKEKNPLAHPEKMLKLSFDEIQKKHQMGYATTSEHKNSVFKFHIFENKIFEQLSPEDFTEAQRELEAFRESNAEDYNKNREFKYRVDGCSDELKKFKKDFENFKKAKEKLEEIRILKEGCNEELFGDKVEERIKEIVEAVKSIKVKNLSVPLKFFVNEFVFGLDREHEYFRYVFKKSDFDEIYKFIGEVCHKEDIEKIENRIIELKKEKTRLSEDIETSQTTVKQLQEEIKLMTATKEKIESLAKKSNEIRDNLFKFTFPGKYTFFC